MTARGSIIQSSGSLDVSKSKFSFCDLAGKPENSFKFFCSVAGFFFSKTIVLIYSSFEISVLGVIFYRFSYFFVSTKSGKSYLSD